MTIGVLILFALLGSFICAKSRTAGGAVVFALIALALFISTPAGAGLPGLVTAFLSSLSDATQHLTAPSGTGTVR